MEDGVSRSLEGDHVPRGENPRVLLGSYALTVLVFGGYSTLQLLRLGWQGWSQYPGKHAIMPAAIILTLQAAVAFFLARDSHRLNVKVMGYTLAGLSVACIFVIPILIRHFTEIP